MLDGFFAKASKERVHLDSRYSRVNTQAGAYLGLSGHRFRGKGQGRGSDQEDWIQGISLPPGVNLEASPGGSPLGKQGLKQSPTGVRCRKPVAIAYGLTGDSPSFLLWRFFIVPIMENLFEQINIGLRDKSEKIPAQRLATFSKAQGRGRSYRARNHIR
jgi:hypothetical protein